MPQLQLPIFPEGTTLINANIGFTRENDSITYIYGILPVFAHHVNDIRSFRMITSQLYINGVAKQSEICRAFGVSAITVKRGVKLYRKNGTAGFFEEPKRRGAAVLTPPMVEKVQELLDAGHEIPCISQELGLKYDTLRKAVKSGKVHKPVKKKEIAVQEEKPFLCSKSERNVLDAKASIGMGATDTFGRMATSIFKFDALDPKFTICKDVPNGGVLLALPALLATGLLSHSEKYFELPKGYYRLDSIFLLLSFMALSRLKTVERLRYYSPGEWGKLLGLDRIPEVKTLREKIGILSRGDQTSQWAGNLSQDWMKIDLEASGVLYIDGHVRVYSGHQTKLPRHYVSRQRLCLRATVDYWVNAMDSQPFFLINKEIDPGLINVLENEIVPRLEREIPCQPSLFQQDEDPYLHRFTLVFDREGYSPGFFNRMKAKRIACLTYHKYPGKDWPEEEFVVKSVKLSSGNIMKMNLAERGTFLGKKLWVREIRKLTESGHQTSIISTDYKGDLAPIAVAMFARWSQENFFRYMRQHYNLDSLIDYSTENISDTIKVVNPKYRKLDGEIRKLTGKLNRKWVQFQKIILPDMIESKNVENYQQEKGDLQEEIIALEKQKEELKEKRKNTEKHITVGQLPQEEQFQRLGTKSKYFIDTIKMIAYRSETAMVNIVRETMSRLDGARRLLQAIYINEADLIPDYKSQTLTIRLHQLANRSSGKTLMNLCRNLNTTKTKFPGTELRLIYELVS